MSRAKCEAMRGNFDRQRESCDGKEVRCGQKLDKNVTAHHIYIGMHRKVSVAIVAGDGGWVVFEKMKRKFEHN